MSDAAIDVARRWFEVMWNTRDEALLCELMHEDCQGEAEGGRIENREAFVETVFRAFCAAFPDLRLRVRGVVADGDQVVVRWDAQGTHKGDALGVPATGFAVTFRGMSWLRIRDGRIAEGEDCWNQTGLQQALQTGCDSGTVRIVR